jgi:hypothetical protein
MVYLTFLIGLTFCALLAENSSIRKEELSTHPVTQNNLPENANSSTQAHVVFSPKRGRLSSKEP